MVGFIPSVDFDVDVSEKKYALVIEFMLEMDFYGLITETPSNLNLSPPDL